MKIILKNGKEIDLDWNPIVYEYLEEYDGGIEQLRKDLDEKNSYYLVMNFIIYCMIQAVYDEEISYREAISLVDVEDYPKIIDYIIQKENINNTNQFNEDKTIDVNKQKKHRY